MKINKNHLNSNLDSDQLAGGSQTVHDKNILFTCVSTICAEFGMKLLLDEEMIVVCPCCIWVPGVGAAAAGEFTGLAAIMS